jgi:exopolysaccharide biosynthesis polyprenyl glycosylphosphotransferase
MDGAAILLSFWVASLLRVPMLELIKAAMAPFGVEVVGYNIDGLADIYWLLFVIAPVTPLVLGKLGFYDQPMQHRLGRSLPKLLTGLAVVFFVVLVLAVVFQLQTSSRLVLAMGVGLAAGLILARDMAVAHWSRVRAKGGIGRENVVLAGIPEEIEAWWQGIDGATRLYWNVVGRFDLLTGDLDEFRRTLGREGVSRVLFAVKSADFGRVSEAIEICEVQGVEAWVAAGFLRTRIARPTFDFVGDQAMFVLRSTPDLSWSFLLKGVMDRVGALVLLVATLWLWVVVWAGIRLSSPGPVFFSQMRAGRYGRPFRMWKFRTMDTDAEARLAETKEQKGNEMTGPAFKLKDDPRIFPFGGWLRRHSIDELPQLLNVLKGEMSLVGPRPLPLYEVEAIEKSAHRRRMSMKPGLTCIWQVSGRSEIADFGDWVELDLEYIDNWSLWLDAKLLLKTVWVVAAGKGAQ